ncbi:MAG: twin-arginine translocase subunit TatC [Candidatus Poseidoniaceae archaeon]
MSRNKGLELEHDPSLPVQLHFDTLTQKATLGFVLVALLTFAFITKIDAILEATLAHLNPCDDSSCLALYEPASWSVVRWLSAVFMAVLCVLPFALVSMYSFAKPGLTQSEQTMMKQWMFLSSTIGYCSLIVLFYVLIPSLYSIGDSIHRDMGLTSQYDAVNLFTLALSIFWALLVAYVIAFATTTAGALGLITENNQDWWRTRVLGIGGVVLFLSLPGRWNGTNIILLGVTIVVLEYSIQKSVRVARELLSPNALFDHEGRRRFVSYVDCSCQGVAYPIDTSPQHTGLLKYDALCENIEERQHLIDTIAKYRLTDVIIGGCDASPLPTSFKHAADSVQCQLRGLDLLALQGAVPSENPVLKDEIRIHLENVVDPWTSSQRIEAFRSNLNRATTKQFKSVSSQSYPELEHGVLRVSTKDWSQDEINALNSIRT